MLFDSLEEQLDLPAAAIEIGDDSRRGVGIVRQEPQHLAFGILNVDQAQDCRVPLRRVETGQCTDVIALHAVYPVQGPRAATLKVHIRLDADDNTAVSLMQAMQLVKVDITPIHDVEVTSVGDQQAEDVDLVPLAVADVDEAWNVTALVEQRVKLDHRLVGTKRHPMKDRQARVDNRSIGGIDCVVQINAEGLVDIESASNADQMLGEISVDAPVPHRNSVGRCAAGHGTAKPHVIGLDRLASQAGFNIAQAFPIGQLGEGHAHVVVEAGDLFDLVRAPIVGHAATKVGQRQMHHTLCEDVSAHANERCLKSGGEDRKFLGAAFKSRQVSNMEYPLLIDLLGNYDVKTLGHD